MVLGVVGQVDRAGVVDAERHWPVGAEAELAETAPAGSASALSLTSSSYYAYLP